MAVFAIISVSCLLVGILLFVFVKKLKALTHGAEDITPTVAFVEPE